MFKKMSLLMVVALFVFASIATANNCASDSKGKILEKAEEAKATVNNARQMTFNGTLVCQGCDLKSAEGARAACMTYGHKHALKTDKGVYINFLENEYSADLLKGEKYHNAKVEVRGTYFANANMLDVESFSADGNKKAWCGHCKSMDSCMVSK